MEAPPEWRVGFAAQFDADLERFGVNRSHPVITAWVWALQRAPLRTGSGLTKPNDDRRVLEDEDPLESLRFVAGVEIDAAGKNVSLCWLDVGEIE